MNKIYGNCNNFPTVTLYQQIENSFVIYHLMVLVIPFSFHKMIYHFIFGLGDKKNGNSW